jgi:hypothetical protein
MQCGSAQLSLSNRAHNKCGQCTSELCMSSRKHCVRVCWETCTRVKTAIQTIFMFHHAGKLRGQAQHGDADMEAAGGVL